MQEVNAVLKIEIENCHSDLYKCVIIITMNAITVTISRQRCLNYNEQKAIEKIANKVSLMYPMEALAKVCFYA